MPKAGRPPKAEDERRQRRVVVLLTEDEYADFAAQAGRDGVGPWLRGLGLEAVRRAAKRSR